MRKFVFDSQLFDSNVIVYFLEIYPFKGIGVLLCLVHHFVLEYEVIAIERLLMIIIIALKNARLSMVNQFT